MSRLAVAQQSQIDAIHRESHALWGAGLSLGDYGALWAEVAGTPWAIEHARFCVWLDEEGRVLSSLKLYRPLIGLQSEVRRGCVLGAIFTPRAERRRGHAARMVRRAVDDARREGACVAMLYSDIGVEYYGALGFRALPAEEQWGSLTRQRAEAGLRLRDMAPDDLPTVRRLHDEFCRGRSIAMVRDPEHWEFLRVRSAGYFSRLADRDIRQRWRVAERDGRVVGYLIAVEGRGEWSVREVGAESGDPGVMASVLRAGAFDARRSGLRRFYAWLPREVISLLSDWEIRSQPRRRAVPMILPLEGRIDLGALGTVSAAYLPYQDQF
jgi:predicted N-acetyltransferase YhbS